MHVQAVEDIKRYMHQRDIRGAAEIADRLSLLFNPVAKESAYVVSTILADTVCMEVKRHHLP